VQGKSDDQMELYSMGGGIGRAEFWEKNEEILTIPRPLRHSSHLRTNAVGWQHNLRTLASDSPSELDVLGHNGHPLGVDGAQVGVLK